jgi:hypothetical protein
MPREVKDLLLTVYFVDILHPLDAITVSGCDFVIKATLSTWINFTLHRIGLCCTQETLVQVFWAYLRKIIAWMSLIFSKLVYTGPIC